MGVRQASRDQPTVPGQQGGGRHTEGWPGRARKESTEGGQKGAIGGLVGGTPHLAPENFHFMAQGEAFGLLGACGCRVSHPAASRSEFVFVDEATQPVRSSHLIRTWRRGR